MEQLNGWFSRSLLTFHCERCGFPSSRYSMYAMTYDDDGQFAMRRASEDEARMIAARTLAHTSFDMWNPGCSQAEYEAWLEEHREEVVAAINAEADTEVNAEDKYPPKPFGHRAIKFAKFKDDANKELTQILLEAVLIKREISLTDVLILL